MDGRDEGQQTISSLLHAGIPHPNEHNSQRYATRIVKTFLDLDPKLLLKQDVFPTVSSGCLALAGARDTWVLHDEGVGKGDNTLLAIRKTATGEIEFLTCQWHWSLDVGKFRTTAKAIQDYAAMVNLPGYSIRVVCPSAPILRRGISRHWNQLGISAGTKLYVTDGQDLEVALSDYKANDKLRKLAELKPLMALRPHQLLALLKAMDRVRAFLAAHPASSVLGVSDKSKLMVVAIGAIPRSGKSHIALGIADEYSRLLQALSEWQQQYPGLVPRVLVLTSQPNETGPTWTQAFSKYRQFDTAASSGVDSSRDSTEDGGLHVDSQPGSSTGSSSVSTSFPPRWVVLGTQALYAAGRKERAAAAATTATAADDNDEDSEVEGEPQGPTSSGSQGSTGPADSVATVKVIAADPLTAAEWERVNDRPTLESVIGRGFDIIFYDEAHHGSTTKLSRAALQRLMAGAHCLLVLVSGTYRRPVQGFGVCKEGLFTWSLIDVCNARTGDLKALADAHGAGYVRGALEACHIIRPEQALNLETDDLGLSAYQLAAFRSLYASVPEPRLARLHLDYAKVKDLIPGLLEGQLTFATLLQLAPQAPSGLQQPQFQYSRAVKHMVDELLATTAEASVFCTILAFLHCGARGTDITKTCEAFQAVCEAAATGQNYNYLSLPAMKGNTSLPRSIQEAVQDAFKAGKAGLILLTGHKGGTGLDVQVIGHVWMLTDHQSADLWMQRSYRCLTERRSGDVVLRSDSGSMALPAKKSGVVFEAQPYRALQSLVTYCSPSGLGPSSSKEARQLFKRLLRGKIAALDDNFFDGLTDSDGSAVAAADIERKAQILTNLYCATRLVEATSTVKRMTDMPLRVRLSPELADLLVVPKDRSSPFFVKAKERTKEICSPKRKEPGGGGGSGGGGGAGGDVGGFDVSVVLVRVWVMLACMSHRSLLIDGLEVEPTLEHLCQWLQQQQHSDQLQGSIGSWIGWVSGSAVAETEDRKGAWGALVQVAKQLEDSHPEEMEQLLQLARTVRWMLQEEIDKDSSRGSSTPESSAAAASRPCSNKVGIVHVINDFLSLCGERLLHNSTPRGLLDNMLEKLTLAQPDVFTRAVQQQHNPAAAAAATVLGAGSNAARSQPRRFLDLGAGTGIMAATIYDRLSAAGWDHHIIESQLLHVAEPDIAMQYLLAVVFPSFKPVAVHSGSGSSSSSGGAGGGSGSSSSGLSLPQNIGGIPLPGDSAGPSSQETGGQQQTSKQQQQPYQQQLCQTQGYDVIVSYLPHCGNNDQQLISHHLAAAACNMLQPGGHALLLFNSRWRARKRKEYVDKRRQLSIYLADIWDVVISTPGRPSLLRHPVAKNEGEQLVHLAKLEQQQLQQLRVSLGYKHVHSSAALAGAAAAGTLLGPAEGGAGQQSPQAAAAAAEELPPAAQDFLRWFDAIIQSGDLSVIQKVARLFAAAPAPATAAAVACPAAAGPAPAVGPAAAAGSAPAAGPAAAGSHSSSSSGQDDDSNNNDDLSDDVFDDEDDEDDDEDDQEEQQEEEEDEPAASSSTVPAGCRLLSARTEGLVMPPEEHVSADETEMHTVKMYRTKGQGKGQGCEVWITEAAATAQGPLPSKYTVVTTRSADRYLPWGTAAAFNTGQTPNQVTGYLKLVHPSEVFAGIVKNAKGGQLRTLVGWQFDTKPEAENFMGYLRSPLVRLLVSLQKPDSKVEDAALAFVPLPAMTEPWTDQKCQQLLGFTDQEMQHIKSRVQGEQQIIKDKPSSGDSSSSQGEVARANASGIEYLRQFVQTNGSAFGFGAWPAAALGKPASGKKRKASDVQHTEQAGEEQGQEQQQQQQVESLDDVDDVSLPVATKRRVCDDEEMGC